MKSPRLATFPETFPRTTTVEPLLRAMFDIAFPPIRTEPPDAAATSPVTSLAISGAARADRYHAENAAVNGGAPARFDDEIAGYVTLSLEDFPVLDSNFSQGPTLPFLAVRTCAPKCFAIRSRPLSKRSPRRRRIRDAARGLELGEPKTATSKRRCDLPASAIEVLREHKRATEGNLNEHGLVFPSKTGGFVDRCNFHSLRHAGNCMLAAGGGVALKSLQVRLGHSTSRTTFDAYTHLFESDGGHAAQAMDLLLRGVTRGVTASDGPLPENAGHEKNPYG